MDKIKENKNFFDEEEKEYLPFTNYNLNGCIYIFNDIYKDNDNNYYKLNKNNKYTKININKLQNIKYFKAKDINGNNINIFL